MHHKPSTEDMIKAFNDDSKQHHYVCKRCKKKAMKNITNTYEKISKLCIDCCNKGWNESYRKDKSNG